MPTFDSKDDAREHVWDRLEADGEAAFPFPPHGRIPNFKGARSAAERLLADPIFDGVTRIKVNPDAPQRFVRALALERGIELLVPTPRLRAGFRRLCADAIPKGEQRRAVSLAGMDEWGEPVPLEAMPEIDLIVTGCVAVTRAGKRCGKGEGYSDLEFAILRELGHPVVPVVTTVHPIQVVDDFPRDDHDIALALIATPDECLGVEDPLEVPAGLDWSKLSDEDLDAMPVLRKLRDRG
jgi:5-formyltetrahydrofolate cyclo-ligase